MLLERQNGKRKACRGMGRGKNPIFSTARRCAARRSARGENRYFSPRLRLAPLHIIGRIALLSIEWS